MLAFRGFFVPPQLFGVSVRGHLRFLGYGFRIKGWTKRNVREIGDEAIPKDYDCLGLSRRRCPIKDLKGAS